jgi:hypothetical protein
MCGLVQCDWPEVTAVPVLTSDKLGELQPADIDLAMVNPFDLPMVYSVRSLPISISMGTTDIVRCDGYALLLVCMHGGIHAAMELYEHVSVSVPSTPMPLS